MKRLTTILSIISVLIMGVTAQESESKSESTCTLGFAFEISNDKSWGYMEPVVVHITPGSPADRAGLKLNDILLSVNGHGTYRQSLQTLRSWFAENDVEVTLAVRNFNHAFREIHFRKDCRHPNAISEAQLAPVFAFYSLEDVQDRRFLIPVKTRKNEEALFYSYRTFAFAPVDEATRELDERINAIFIRELTAKGMTYDPVDPDFIIQTFYSYQNNSLFKPESPTIGSYQPVWRFDTRSHRTIRLPVYDPSEAVRIEDIAFNLEFGYRFYDRKFIAPGEMSLIWEGEVKERLTENYLLIDYLELNLPLMLLKFPYPGNPEFATYEVKYQKYHYTGIGYDMNDLKSVVSVDPGSPAQLAGILPGDVVTHIQGQPFSHRSSQSLTEGYRRFISETIHLRDKNTRYTDSNGFRDCMFWDVAKYHAVSEALADSRRYRAAFSYLFGFNQYVDWQTPLTINIGIERNGQPMSFAVTPEVLTSSHILAE